MWWHICVCVCVCVMYVCMYIMHTVCKRHNYVLVKQGRKRFTLCFKCLKADLFPKAGLGVGCRKWVSAHLKESERQTFYQRKGRQRKITFFFFTRVGLSLVPGTFIYELKQCVKIYILSGHIGEEIPGLKNIQMCLYHCYPIEISALLKLLSVSTIQYGSPSHMRPLKILFVQFRNSNYN